MRKIFKLILVCIIAVLLQGCSRKFAVVYTAEPLYHKTNIINKNYRINTINEISVGDMLISIEDIGDYGNKILVNTYSTNTSFSLSFPKGEILFNKGAPYYSIYNTKGFNLIQATIIPKDINHQWMVYMPINGNGEVVGNSLLYSKTQHHPLNIFSPSSVELEDHRNFNFYSNSKLPIFNSLGKTLRTIDNTTVHYFRKELIYTGKSKNTIKLLYREYSTNMIRDAYTYELSYDLDESNIIRYKNMRFEVIDSTNERIKYKVISD